MASKLKASEFEGTGPKKSGVFGIRFPSEQLRIIYRTEQDPRGPVDLDKKPDQWRVGGVKPNTEKNWQRIR